MSRSKRTKKTQKCFIKVSGEWVKAPKWCVIKIIWKKLFTSRGRKELVEVVKCHM